MRSLRSQNYRRRRNPQSSSRIPLLGIALLITLTGCAKNYSMSPLPDSEKVTVTIKVPEDLEPKPMRVMYRSSVCKSVVRDAGGRPEKLDGHSGHEVKLVRQGGGDLYTAELYVNAGGACDWQLSNVVFGVKYPVPNRFGEGVKSGLSASVIVIFDDNNAQLRVPGSKVVEGRELKVVNDYYPWVNESFIRGYVKSAELAGEANGFHTFKARKARLIYFEPSLHSKYVVISKEPTVHKPGMFITFYYPDGTAQSDGRYVPDFKKIQEIRMRAEAKE